MNHETGRLVSHCPAAAAVISDHDVRRPSIGLTNHIHYRALTLSGLRLNRHAGIDTARVAAGGRGPQRIAPVLIGGGVWIGSLRRRSAGSRLGRSRIGGRVGLVRAARRRRGCDSAGVARDRGCGLRGPLRRRRIRGRLRGRIRGGLRCRIRGGPGPDDESCQGNYESRRSIHMSTTEVIEACERSRKAYARLAPQPLAPSPPKARGRARAGQRRVHAGPRR